VAGSVVAVKEVAALVAEEEGSAVAVDLAVVDLAVVVRVVVVRVVVSFE